MPEYESKKKWDAENTLIIHLKINKNQDPELYDMFSKAENKGGLLRELLAKATK